jgi:hypothetical protein
MGKSMKAAAIVLAACGLIGAGCGSSSNSSNSAVSRCKDAADRIGNDQAKSAALDACDQLTNVNTAAVTNAVKTATNAARNAATNAATNAANSATTAVNNAKSTARQACESAANAIPAGVARDNALAGCKNIK